MYSISETVPERCSCADKGRPEPFPSINEAREEGDLEPKPAHLYILVSGENWTSAR
jgi:hypothetical protein